MSIFQVVFICWLVGAMVLGFRTVSQLHNVQVSGMPEEDKGRYYAMMAFVMIVMLAVWPIAWPVSAMILPRKKP